MGDRLQQAWRQIPPARRVAFKAAAWGLALVVVWQGLWLPGQQHLALAEARLHQQRVLAQHLLRLSGTPAAVQQAGPPLTAARLSERAQAAGLATVDLHSNGQQLTMTVQGAPQTVMGWLQALEREGADLSEIRLQAADDQLQARIGRMLDDG
ncbi:type II secretion system protein GspM [Pseudomonas sp. NPDC089554]|uniref:type II secretion system protein GspM n=1 Tax=Pseudomonas sp. NPDC089554 TaxID=3390653 RepID=UPI003CFED473